MAERIEEVRKATVATIFLANVRQSLEKVAKEYEGQFRVFDLPSKRGVIR